jgi:predicted transcriptional regulator
MEVDRMRKLHVEVMSSGEALKRFSRVASIAELASLLSPKRMELLHHVARNPGLSIRALAGALRRDYKNVHTDVSKLEGKHLLERDEDGRVKAPFDELVIRAPLREAA